MGRTAVVGAMEIELEEEITDVTDEELLYARSGRVGTSEGDGSATVGAKLEEEAAVLLTDSEDELPVSPVEDEDSGIGVSFRASSLW